MNVRKLHGWDVTPRQAAALQRRLAAMVTARPLKKTPELVAGLDCAPAGGGGEMAAAAVVLRIHPDKDPPERFEIVEVASARLPCRFAYVPGLLSFREAPASLAALAALKSRPGAVLVDGQGIAHPRGLGLASHIGLFIDAPTIGCAKKRLVGEFTEPAPPKGSLSPLFHKGRSIGTVLRTRDNVKCIFVSPGNRIDTAGAVRVALLCTGRYRLPEATRLAHMEAGRTAGNGLATKR